MDLTLPAGLYHLVVRDHDGGGLGPYAMTVEHWVQLGHNLTAPPFQPDIPDVPLVEAF